MNTPATRHCREAAPSFAAQRRPSFATKWRSSFVIAAALALCAAPQRAAAADVSFAYQGVLRAEDGGALPERNQTVEFRLYDSPDGETALWGRTVAVLLDENGLFNAELSDSAGSTAPGAPGTGLAGVFAANADKSLFVGLTVVGTSGEIAPRQKILPVPYAVFASDVASASGDFAAAGVLTAASATFSGGVSAASLDVAGSVAASSLSVTGDATVNGDLQVGGAVSGFGTVPLECIILWSGSADDIPNGWALCNGQTVNGHTTPDLRNRFVVGAGTGSQYTVGETGGEEKHTLSESEMPSHSHTYDFKGADFKGAWDDDNYVYDASGHYKDRSQNDNRRTTNSTGGGAAHENRPPYYALCYIMRVR
jgi:microcystin-dependent protein